MHIVVNRSSNTYLRQNKWGFRRQPSRKMRKKKNASESSIARHICLNGAVQLFVTIQLGEMHDKKFINTITERFPTLHFTQNWAVVVPGDPTSVNDSIASLTVIPF